MQKTLKRNMRIVQIIIIVVIFIIPVTLLIPQQDLTNLKFQDIVYILARVFALTAILTFTTNLFLAGRYIFLDRFVGGLEKIFRLHRLTGKVAYLFISMHILLITLYYFLFSSEIGIKFLLATDIPTLIGKVAFSLLTIILGITLYVKLKYEIKQSIHKLLGLVVLLGAIHGVSEMSDLYTNLPLRIYVLTILNIGLLSYLFRNIFRSKFVKQNKYKVFSNSLISKNVNELVLEPLNEKLEFNPGQFLFIRFKQKGIPSERHPFSITSHNSDRYLSINPKISGDFTKLIPQIKAGTKCFIEGPYGGFNYRNSEKNNQVWIAGGIGITPFISMFKDFKASSQSKSITLIHTVSDEYEAIKSTEFENFASQNPNFKYIKWVTKEKGRVSIDSLKEICDINNSSFLLCGPEPMVKSLRDQMKNSKIDSANIEYELFKML